MAECIAEDDLFDLAHERRSLGDVPAIEEHLADCPACSALLCTLLAAPRAETARRELAGRTIGPYRLDGLIGAGAMGEVYRAWDDRLSRHVAVKVLSRQFAESPERVRRLEAEGRAAAAIAHVNVVTVYDTGTADGMPFIVSELISGESLRSVIDRGPVRRDVAIDLAVQLARGLEAAHARGVVHRDLKPGNLIVTDGGTLKILDFGLAKHTGDRDAEATEPGTLLGTSGYLSPEQARGEPADARSDLFAAGAILYELLSGRRAFAGATFAERLTAVLRDTPEPLDDVDGGIVMRCLEKDPRRRFQSATDLLWALQRSPGSAERPRAVRARPVSRRTFLLGAAATGVGGALLGRAWSPARRPAALPDYRQLSYRQGRVASARFTHDGGSIVYAAAWEELPMAIYIARLGGGGMRALELPSAQLLAVSSRGQLALSLDHRFIEGFHQRGQLALAPLEGGAPRGLGIEVQHADFTPDGSELAIVRRMAGRFRLELPVGRVVFEGDWLSHPRVSPDGRYVACFAHDDPNDDRGVIMIVPRTGGTAHRIAGEWSSIDGLAWAPDGNALWISASREGGNNSVWAVDLAGTERVRVPVAGRLRVHDLAADGRLAVTHVSGRVRTLGRAPGGPDEVDLGISDVSIAVDLSRDGRTLLLAEVGDVDSTDGGAYLRATGGGAALRLGGAVPFDLDDDRGVLAIPYAVPRHLAVFPVREGQPRQVPIPGLADLRWARWAAEDRIVVCGPAANRPPRLWRLDPDRTLTPISEEGVVGAAAVSPDGRRVALIVDRRLLVIDLDGGAPHVVPGSFGEDSLCGWYATGHEVFVRSHATPIRVRRVDVATGSATPHLAIAPPPVGLRGVDTVIVNPAGDAYAYSYGHELSRLFTMTTADLDV